MANSWFQFKKFIIRQDKTAMKVGTDGVLLGAWTNVPVYGKILDVGTGTGLIALMLAQRSESLIDAVEIEPLAVEQANENISGSPWADRIRVINNSFQDFYKNNDTSYDLIVCNPPFFTRSLKAKTPERSLARHNEQLEPGDLVHGVSKLLNPGGHFSLIVPADKESEMKKISLDNGLFPSKILRLKPLPGKPYKRILMDFSFVYQEVTESEMIIESGARHGYSAEYRELTKDFYLFE